MINHLLLLLQRQRFMKRAFMRACCAFRRLKPILSFVHGAYAWLATSQESRNSSWPISHFPGHARGPTFIGLVACLGYSCLDCLVSQTLILTTHTCMSHYNDNCCTTKPRSQLNHRACAVRAGCSCRVPAHSNKARRGTRLSACSLTLQYRRACRHASKNICSITFAACRHASHNRPSAPGEPAKHLLRPQL
jgi:hypothetical protein